MGCVIVEGDSLACFTVQMQYVYDRKRLAKIGKLLVELFRLVQAYQKKTDKNPRL